MRATDVMTSEVTTVHEDTSAQTAAQLMAERGISALPVVDRDNRVIGMVSEGDLLHRAETGTERRRSWWLEMMASTNRLAEDYIKSHGGKVKDVMTHDVLSVTEETTVADIAVLLETNRVKRVPVLRDGKLVGIVSRANLVRALAMTKSEPAIQADSDDQTIRQKLITELTGQEWVHMWAADIIVRDRVVHLWFSDDRSEEERQALRIAAENIAGVQRVEEHIVPARYLTASPDRR
jgi:CBS domain-containing protein